MAAFGSRRSVNFWVKWQEGAGAAGEIRPASPERLSLGPREGKSMCVYISDERPDAGRCRIQSRSEPQQLELECLRGNQRCEERKINGRCLRRSTDVTPNVVFHGTNGIKSADGPNKNGCFLPQCSCSRDGKRPRASRTQFLFNWWAAMTSSAMTHSGG